MLHALVQALCSVGDPRRHPEETSRLLRCAHLSSLPALPWRHRGYTRNLVWRDRHFELLLLCWSAGARTPIHDHDGQECWFQPLGGTFATEDFRLDGGLLLVERRENVRSLDHQPGGEQIHRVSCSEPGLSLQLYAEPVERCRIYDAGGRAHWRLNRYDSYLPRDPSIELAGE